MFHYKPSSYWGTPIYGNPQIAVWTINKWHYEPSSSSFAHSLSKDPSILETWNWSKTSFSLGWCRTSFYDCSKKRDCKDGIGFTPPKKSLKQKTQNWNLVLKFMQRCPGTPWRERQGFLVQEAPVVMILGWESVTQISVNHQWGVTKVSSPTYGDDHRSRTVDQQLRSGWSW